MTSNSTTSGVAIVTGAAGGMGSASATRLAATSDAMILCDMKPDRLEEIAAPIREGGCKVDLLTCDLADPAFPQQLLELLGDRPISAVIHTAGLSPTMGDADRVLTVNYDGTSRLINAIRPRMAEGSCAVMISSCSAHSVTDPDIVAAIGAIGPEEDSSSLRPFTPDAGAAYAISKRAVQIMVEKRASDFGKNGARLVSISPGLIDTAMGRAEQKAHPIMDQMKQATPLGRYGLGDEIAATAVFLCSPDASFISGCDIQVDGGVIGAMNHMQQG